MDGFVIKEFERKNKRTNERKNKRTKEATANPRNGWIIGQSRLSCETNAKYGRSTYALKKKWPTGQ